MTHSSHDSYHGSLCFKYFLTPRIEKKNSKDFRFIHRGGEEEEKDYPQEQIAHPPTS